MEERMRRLSIAIISFVIVFVFSAHTVHAMDVQAIVDELDKLYRSDTSAGEMEMKIQTSNWSRTLKMKVWSEGIDKTFVHITSPKKDAGIATLRNKTEMWNFFPKINKVMKVPPSMMMSSWMGSDFTNDDLVKESSYKNDYSSKLITPEGAAPDFYYIELLPNKDSPVVWGKIIFTVRKDGYIPVTQEFYDEKSRKMRVMEFKDIKDIGGRMIPSVLELVPLTKEGQKTTVIYKDIKFDIKLPSDTFTLRNLQKRR
jgi:outer membrane lipoprotein-sorting protein